LAVFSGKPDRGEEQMKSDWIVFFAVVGPAAFSAEVEEIVVTGNSDGTYAYYEMPSVTITKKADFLVQNIRLVNDSRSPERRKAEIVSTIENLLERADSMRGMALSYGQGFLEPINLNDESLQLLEDRERFDTSYVDLYAKVALDPGGTPKSQIARLREFVASVEKAGRTEIEPLGDIGLSIIGPEQYRYEIIRKIAEEKTRIIEAMQADCDFSIGGLEGRVEWERTSVSEVTLYIPYGIEISDCAT
jgi:hypothetical protein